MSVWPFLRDKAARLTKGDLVLQYGNHTKQVHTRLRELIVEGELAPGTRIIESELVDSLGVSRTPVRSALQWLLQEGFLVSAGTDKKSKLAVAPLTQEDAAELFTLVGLLEGAGAMGAAAVRSKERGALVRELRWINQDLSKAADSPGASQNRIFKLDTRFHARYVEVGAGPRILTLFRSTKPQAERYIRLYIRALIDEIGTSVGEHEQTIDAIEAGDPRRAREAVETNWENASERLQGVIGEVGERGAWLRK